MLFNSLQFAIFFGAVYLMQRALPVRWRGAMLLVASWVFYALWIPVHLPLLLVDILVNYLLLLAMVRSARPRVYLAASVVFTLGLLATFKYSAFLVESALPVLGGLGFSPRVPDFFLPLGISFYSFQILGLTIDCYRGNIQAPRSLARYALFVSFFPQLVAGPILRGAQLLPQLARGGERTPERTRRGVWLIASGVIKKVVFADFLLAFFVEQVFSVPNSSNAPFALIAVYSFAFQIYFDFSGYTDIARGVSCLLGYELPLNFMEPYLSRNPAEFWRRWHITLSQWLRDYLYIPLGGNRAGAVRTGINLLITMLLGGLWHGAAWTFVIWGGPARGSPHRPPSRGAARRGRGSPPLASGRSAIFLCFHAVCLIWIFFRAPDLAGALTLLSTIFTGSYALHWPLQQTGVVIACALFHALERYARLRADRIQQLLSGPRGALIEGSVLGVLAGLAFATSGAGAEFIYFQF